jgi:hypothetical protein
MDGITKENFEQKYKIAKGYIEAAVVNEKATASSTVELSGNSQGFTASVNKIITAIDAAGKAAIAAFDAVAETGAKNLGLQGIAFKPSELETKAKTIIPKSTPMVVENGYRGYSQLIAKVDPAVREKYPMKGRMMDTQEVGRLCNGKNSALDIKKLLDTQLKTGETELQDVINYIYILKEAGLVAL